MEELLNKMYASCSNVVSDMRNTDHGQFIDGRYVPSPYHIEGDVWAHTLMVMREVESNPLADEADMVTALLHDVGKAYTREVKDGKVSFYGHAGVSAMRAIEMVEQLGIHRDRQRIVEVVSLHHDFMSVLSEHPSDKVKERIIGLGSGISVTSLFLQMACDSMGRIPRTTREEISVAVEWYMGIAKKAEDGREERNPKPHTGIPFVVMVGLPCSGKSTFVSENLEGYSVHSRDDLVQEMFPRDTYRESFEVADHRSVDVEFDRRLMEAIKNRQPIVVDKTNMSQRSRRGVLSNVPSEYVKEAVFMATPVSWVHDRIGRRNAEGDKVIPLSVVDKMERSFSVPLYNEFDDITWIWG